MFARIYGWLPCMLAVVLTGVAQDAPWPARAQTNPPFVLKSWHAPDGLPQDSVMASAQSADEYLWVGTGGGLARFDGVRFTTFGLADGLKSLSIRALANDGQGGLWIGTLGGGLSHWRDGEIKTLTTQDGLLSDDIYSLAAEEPGGVWVGTARGLQHWGAEGFKRIGEAEGVTGLIPALATSAADGLWVSVESVGFFRVQRGRCERVALPPPSEARHPTSLLVDKEGDVWAGMGNGIVLRRHRGAWIGYNQTDGVPYSYIYCLAQGTDGEIWAGSHQQGLYVFRDGRFQAVPSPDPSIRSVTVSRGGVVWVGTQAGGLDRLTSPRVAAYSLGRSTRLGDVGGLAEDPPGQFWVATWGGGLQRGPLEKLETVTDVPDLERNPFLRSALRTSDGTLHVIGAKQVGTWDAVTNGFRFAAPTNGILISACEDADGSLLLGGRDGVLRRFSGGVFEPVASGNFSAQINAVARGRQPGVWVATQGAGLFHWNAGQVRRWTTAEGLPTPLLRALHVDAEETLWIGTAGGGLAWLKEGRIHSVNSRQGLVNDSISPILEDDDGHLWLGSIRGISRVPKSELFAVAAGRAARVHPLALDESDGMPTAECTSGYSPAGLRSADGRLLFSITRHIVAVDPKTLTSTASPPEVRIESVVADGKSIPLTSPAKTFAPGLHELNIEYTAFNYFKPDRIRFRHRLGGLDGEWVEVGGERSARFSLLPPGPYRFEVSAANEDGHWSEVPASLDFTLAPLYWQTGWFRALLAVCLLAAGAAVMWRASLVRIRRAQARERLARAEAETQQRRNEVAHLARVATLGELSSALAHELNQPLAAILSNAQAAQRFLAQERSDPAEIREILQDIVADDQRASEVIQRLRRLLKKGEFHPETLAANDGIRDVLRLMQHDLTQRGVAVVTELAEGLPTVRADRVQLQQVLINLILNAVDAMIASPPHARTLTLRSQPGEGAGIEISVADTGSGLPPGGAEKVFEPYHTTKAEGLGLGLPLSRSIIAAHGGRLWAEHQPGSGAVFRFTLPAANGECDEWSVTSGR